jgi:hypothetical protein
VLPFFVQALFCQMIFVSGVFQRKRLFFLKKNCCLLKFKDGFNAFISKQMRMHHNCAILLGFSSGKPKKEKRIY